MQEEEHEKQFNQQLQDYKKKEKKIGMNWIAHNY